LARAKRTARAEARRRYRAEHPQDEGGLDDADDLAEIDDAPAPRGRSASSRSDSASGGGRRARVGGLRAFREAYQPADIRGDLRTLPELLLSRAVTIPLLLVVISAVILVLAVQMSPATSVLPGASASPAASAAASPAASGVTTDGSASVSGSPLGIVASILALLFLGIPSPPAIGGIYLAAILAKRSSYLAGGIAGLFGSLGALGAVIAISPDQAAASISVFGQILLTSVVFGIVIGAGLGYYRRLLRLMNPPQNRPTNRSKQAARRR
jgi:hypothetical protein